MDRGGLCEVCINPGQCCRDVFLEHGTGQHAMDAPMSFDQAEHLAMLWRLPFRPARQLPNGTWTWWCTALDERTGRCTAYEARPPLCRNYVAGSDVLCAHYVANHAATSD